MSTVRALVAIPFMAVGIVAGCVAWLFARIGAAIIGATVPAE